LPRPIDGTEAIAAWLARPGVYLESPESRRARRRPPPRLLPMESWGYGGVRPGHPGHHCQVVFGRRGLDNWEVSVSAAMWHHGTSGATLKVYADSWAALLLRAARALRPRLRPELAVLFASDSPPDLPAAVEKRQLVVGWRTWFAGDYAAALGREWLLGLPDAAQRLADGTVAHALSCTVLDMVSAAPGRYERVAPYVRRRGAPVAWPPALH